jgi:CheY-like chemotaxis protein
MVNSVNPQRSAILLVDDNVDARDFSFGVLERADYAVTVAGLGVDAVTFARSMQFDTIFMDITLPDITGFDATQFIRFEEKMQFRPRSRVVALSSHVTQDYRDMASKVGIDDYLTKPLLPQDLIGAVVGLPPIQLHSETPWANTEELLVRANMLHRIPRYLVRVREMADRLDDHLHARKLEAVYIIGHNLKGSGATFGFNKLSSIGVSIESAACTRDLEGVRHSLAALRFWLEGPK